MSDEVVDIARRAGDAILEVYAGEFDVDTKADASPLTEADRRAHEVIVDGLRSLTPELPIISEESSPPPFSERRHWQRYWLVDPLDGTKEFVERNGEFTVNIALIESGEPVFGVVGVPVKNVVYVGDCRKRRAWPVNDEGTTTLATRAMTADAVSVVASRRHGGSRLERYLERLEDSFAVVTRVHLGSSLKFCILAEGGADLYPRLGPTSEWDIAAAQAVLVAAGGAVRQLDGGPVVYNATESFLNPGLPGRGGSSLPLARQIAVGSASTGLYSLAFAVRGNDGRDIHPAAAPAAANARDAALLGRYQGWRVAPAALQRLRSRLLPATAAGARRAARETSRCSPPAATASS